MKIGYRFAEGAERPGSIEGKLFKRNRKTVSVIGVPIALLRGAERGYPMADCRRGANIPVRAVGCPLVPPIGVKTGSIPAAYALPPVDSRTISLGVMITVRGGWRRFEPMAFTRISAACRPMLPLL
jgi:hypothetical protein